MDQAVVRIGGKQYWVAAGEKIIVDRLEGRAKDKLTFKEVLLKISGTKVDFGRPLIKNAVVEAEILVQTKGQKIRISKFKSKSRYRRVGGHRQHLSELKVVKI